MTRTILKGHRAATAIVVAVGGGAMTAGTWLGGEHGVAIGLLVFYVVAGAIVYLWAGRDSDAAAALRVGGDERQRGLDRDATAVACNAMMIAAIIGASFEAARHHGDPGPYGILCAIGGAAYVASFAYYRRLR
jgi:hypothetical protein